MEFKLENISLVQEQNGYIKLKAETGICRITVTKIPKDISNITLEVSNWNADRIEGLSVFNDETEIDMLHSDPPKVNVNVKSGVLKVDFTKEGMQEIKPGSVIQLIAYYL